MSKPKAFLHLDLHKIPPSLHANYSGCSDEFVEIIARLILLDPLFEQIIIDGIQYARRQRAKGIETVKHEVNKNKPIHPSDN